MQLLETKYMDDTDDYTAPEYILKVTSSAHITSILNAQGSKLIKPWESSLIVAERHAEKT